MDQNIFREYDIRGIVGEQLTDETVARVGAAIGRFFQQNGARRVAVGYDARGPKAGPLAIAVVKAKGDDGNDDVFDDAKALVKHNVGG